MFDSDTAFLTYFQSTLRNIGVYTSLSFAALGYSRFYRSVSKNNADIFFNIYFIIVSLVFMAASIYISYTLLNDAALSHKITSVDYIQQWLILPQVLFYFNVGAFILGLYTLYRETTKSSL